MAAELEEKLKVVAASSLYTAFEALRYLQYQIFPT
jgi:hypothetical protein